MSLLEGQPTNEPLDAVNARLAAIVNSSDDAIVSKNLQGIVQSWNAGAERIFGYTAKEMVGRPVATLFPPDLVNEEDDILARIRRGERIDHYETIRMRKDGHRLHVSVTISPVRNAAGEIIGASKIARDITQLKQLMADRDRLLESERAARHESERANRAKDEFLATVSHELRTPLNAILGWAHLLKHGGTAADLSQGLETIERNARMQAQMIDELLDISRIISGKVRLDVQRVDLPRVVEDVLETCRPAAAAKEITLTRVINPDASPVSGDPNRLQQIVWNLLTNAIKYTPKGGRVQVRVQKVESHVEVTVSDNGQGLDPEFLPQLFRRFSQADSSTTRSHGGLGLGLAIVRHLVELHGGTVHGTSPGVNLGSTFTVNLPLTVNSRETATTSHTSAPALDLSGVKVLVVDDEPDARMLVERVLTNSGAHVTTAASADEAYHKLTTERPDILLCDIGMPVQDGYQLIHRIRALSHEDGGSTPAVALTAFARSEDRRRALLAGFQLHVPKPAEPAELLAVVSSISRINQRSRQ